MCYYLIRWVSNICHVQIDCSTFLMKESENESSFESVRSSEVAELWSRGHKEMNLTLLYLTTMWHHLMIIQELRWWIKHAQAYITCGFISVNGSILRSESLLTELVRKLGVHVQMCFSQLSRSTLNHWSRCDVAVLPCAMTADSCCCTFYLYH